MNNLNTIFKSIEDIFEDHSFSQNVKIGTMNAFKSFLETSSNESIYSFGLYTSGEYSYLTITGNTEEGLKREAVRYSKIDSYKHKLLTDIEARLRWSPCDWDYYDSITVKEFEAVGNFLEELRGYSDDIIDLVDDFDQALDFINSKITQRLDELFIDALKQTKNSFLPISNSIIYSVWMGDQSEKEREFFVSKINSESTTQKYIHESKIGYENF